MHTPIVYIILLNYNNYQDTIECFESLQNITYQNYNIVIVDNNSPNNSMINLLKYMEEKEQEYIYYESKEEALSSSANNTHITLIQSGHNGGYGYGNNIGIKYAINNETDYVLILNNDTIVDKHFLEPLVDKCENDAKIGITSGKIYFYDKPDTIWFNGGGFNSRTESVKHFNFCEKENSQMAPSKITFISGCLMLLPKKVIELVGVFNENYFMYVEDLEFSQRVINKEYKLTVCANSKIWHKVGRSTGGQFSKFSVYWRTKNRNSFIYKNVDGIIYKVISLSIFNLKTLYKLMINNKLPLVLELSRAIRDSFREKNHDT